MTSHENLHLFGSTDATPAYIEAEAALEKCQADFEVLQNDLLLVDSALANWSPQKQSIKSVVDAFSENVFSRLDMGQHLDLPSIPDHLAWRHSLSRLQQAHRALMQEFLEKSLQLRAAAVEPEAKGLGAKFLQTIQHKQYSVLRRVVARHRVMYRLASLE